MLSRNHGCVIMSEVRETDLGWVVFFLFILSSLSFGGEI